MRHSIMEWQLARVPYALDALGFIPQMVSADDPRPAKEQFNETYVHGGGWRPMTGWEFDPQSKALTYPDDPPMQPLAWAQLRDETILVYPYAWVMILQKDGSFEVSRMD